MKIESIRLQNFKAFSNVHLKDIPAFMVVVGANGSGKSTLFDVFGFLHDCLKGNVRQALDKRGRFLEVLSRGCDPKTDSILIELQYRMELTGKERLVTDSLDIGDHDDFHISAARGRKDAAGETEHLSPSGENLPLVARYLHEQHPEIFSEILATMARRVPGISSVEPKLMDDGYLTLRFQDGSFKTPFLDRYVSDGTIKMFAYLVLLHDPKPHPLLCVEEPENQLYPQLMTELAEEFRSYATRGGQVFVTTHSPDFLNALQLDEVCWLVKQNGCTCIHRARDNAQIAAFMADGDQLGYLWKQGFFDGVDPQ